MSGVAQRMLARAQGELQVLEPKVASRFESGESPAAWREVDWFVEPAAVAPKVRQAAPMPHVNAAVPSQPTQRTLPPPSPDPPPQHRDVDIRRPSEHTVERAEQPELAAALPAVAVPMELNAEREPAPAEREPVAKAPVERTILAVRHDIAEIERLRTVPENLSPQPVPGLQPEPAIRETRETRLETRVERERLVASPVERPAPPAPQAPSAPAPPEVRVHIGRIEIIAPPPPAPPPAPVKRSAASPGLNLTDYLGQRRRGEI